MRRNTLRYFALLGLAGHRFAQASQPAVGVGAIVGRYLAVGYELFP